MIPCPDIKESMVHRYLTHLLTKGVKILLIYITTITTVLAVNATTTNQALLTVTLLCYRMYKRAMTAPLMCSLELNIVILLLSYARTTAFYGEVFAVPADMAVGHFYIHRFFLFFDKLNYIVVSFLTAMKNKKQRFKKQELCFCLEVTLLLPYLLTVLLVTTLLDVATVPFLGFAFFYVGYMKP